MKPPRHPTPRTENTTEELCLMGPRHLDELLDLVASFGLGDATPSRSALVARWREGVAEYARLAVTEAGAADAPTIRPLPKAMARHVARLSELDGVNRTFDTVPVAFGLIELDKLVISQYSMTRAVVERICAAHPTPPSPKRLAELCLPLRAPAADFKLVGQNGREFTFASDAHDMRFLDAQVVSPTRVQMGPVMGHAQAVVALSVGFSANLLNVVRYNGRLVLNNGHHRALALRAMGLRYVPCLIQPCASSTDLEQAATSEILGNADLYFESPRPPLLRDFEHPGLTQAFLAPHMRRLLTVKIETQRRLLAI